jgi:hypothetical protein
MGPYGNKILTTEHVSSISQQHEQRQHNDRSHFGSIA